MLNLKQPHKYELTLKDNRLLILDNYGSIKEALYSRSYLHKNLDKGDTEFGEEYIIPSRSTSLHLLNQEKLIGLNMLEVTIPFRDHIKNEHCFIMGFRAEDLIHIHKNRIGSIRYADDILCYRNISYLFYSFNNILSYIHDKMNVKLSVEDIYANKMREVLNDLTYTIVIAQKNKIRFKEIGKL